MTRDKDVASFTCYHDAYTAFRAFGHYLQFGMTLYVGTAHLGVATLGHEKLFVKTAEKGYLRSERRLREDAEHLFLQRIFGHPIVVVEPCLCCPTDVKSGRYVGVGPVEDVDNLAPILHVFKAELLYGGASDNHSVKILLAEHLKVLVEKEHVLYWRVLGCMATKPHKVDFHLQRSVGKQAYEVGFGGHLQGHEVKDDNAQGAYVLSVGPSVVHNKDVLALEKVDGWKFIG